MKIVALFFLAVVAIAVAKPQSAYSTKYDNIDLDNILRSERLLNNYVNCLLEKGPCTPDGKELRTSLPDALATGCKKCTEKQKAGSEKVIRFIVNERPKVWETLAAKFDPNNEYREKYQNKAKESGISV